MKTQDGYDWPTPHEQSPELLPEADSQPRITATEVLESQRLFMVEVPILPLSDHEAVRLLRP